MPVLSDIPSADNKLAISSNGTIYVAFRELKGDNNVRVMKLANGIWNDILDGKAIWDNNATNINLAIDPTDQLPVLAFAQAGTALAVVYKYDGATWNQLGNNNSIGSGECLSMACSPVAGAVFVANKTNKLRTGLDVKQYNGFEWVALGDPSFNGVSGIYASLAVSASGNPYVAFPQYSGTKVDYRTSVMFFNIIPPEKLLSSYIILANKEAQIGENNLVGSGWVGLTEEGRTAQFKQYSRLYPGYVKADAVNIHPTAYVPNVMEGPAEVRFPDMIYSSGNNSGGRITIPKNSEVKITEENVDLVIGENCKVTIEGKTYGKIDVGSGSTVIFSQRWINLVDLNLRKGSVNKKTSVIFKKLGEVYVKQTVDVDEYCTISADVSPTTVAFYIGEEEVGHPGSLSMKAEGTVFEAGAFVPRGQIHVIAGNSSSSRAGEMTGQYIADKFNSDAKYVNWNFRKCFTEGNQPMAPHASALNGTAEEKNSFSLYPVPGNGLLTVRKSTVVSGQVNLIVTDIFGSRVFELGNIPVTGMFEKQIDLRSKPAGIYFVILENNGEKSVRKTIVVK